MKENVLITVPLNEKDEIISIINMEGVEFYLLESKNFDGLSEVAQIIISISTVSVPVIGKILIESIRSKSKISIKYNNIELTGLDENEASVILEKIKK